LRRHLNEAPRSIIAKHIVLDTAAVIEGRAIDEVVIPVIVQVAPGRPVRATVRIRDSTLRAFLDEHPVISVVHEEVGQRV